MGSFRRQGVEVKEREGGSRSREKTREGLGKEGPISPRVERGSNAVKIFKLGSEERRMDVENNNIHKSVIRGPWGP